MTDTRPPPDLYDHVHAIYAHLADLCSKLELLAALAQEVPPEHIDRALRGLARAQRDWLQHHQRPLHAGAHGGVETC